MQIGATRFVVFFFCIIVSDAFQPVVRHFVVANREHASCWSASAHVTFYSHLHHLQSGFFFVFCCCFLCWNRDGGKKRKERWKTGWRSSVVWTKFLWSERQFHGKEMKIKCICISVVDFSVAITRAYISIISCVFTFFFPKIRHRRHTQTSVFSTCLESFWTANSTSPNTILFPHHIWVFGKVLSLFKWPSIPNTYTYLCLRAWPANWHRHLFSL